MNVCRTCHADFASVEAFDEHRVGRHAYLASERPDGRRCLTIDELAAAGWMTNPWGRLVHPRQLRKIAEKAGYRLAGGANGKQTAHRSSESAPVDDERMTAAGGQT